MSDKKDISMQNLIGGYAEQNNGLMMILSMLSDGRDLEEDLFPLALANYMFRSIIEDVHTKYDISDEEMEQMNRCAANRAKLFLERISEDPLLMLGFTAESAFCSAWDNPVITEEEEKRLSLYEETAAVLRETMI